MAVRSGMVAIIARLRLLVGDASGASSQFTDDELEEFLDERRTEARYMELTPAETIASGGAVSYLTYYADIGPWESAPVLSDGDYATLTPATSDLTVGRWTFSTTTGPPVYVTGYYFDLYAAAADVLEAWAARTAQDAYDTREGDVERKRTGKAASLMAGAQKLRERARPVTVPVYRGDAR